MLTECDGTGEPNIEEQVREHETFLLILLIPFIWTCFHIIHHFHFEAVYGMGRWRSKVSILQWRWFRNMWCMQRENRELSRNSYHQRFSATWEKRTRYSYHPRCTMTRSISRGNQAQGRSSIVEVLKLRKKLQNTSFNVHFVKVV